MKNTYSQYIRGKAFIAFILCLLLFSCSNMDNVIPYSKGASYTYVVTVQSEDEILAIDTLILTIEKGGLMSNLSGVWEINWSSKIEKDNDGSRGLDISDGDIELQIPILYDYLEKENLAIAPYPRYSNTSQIGYSFELSHKFLKGYGKLEGVHIRQKMVVEDSKPILFKGKQLECQVITGENISEVEKLGIYRVKTYYNIEYGFLKMIYNYPNGKLIKFELINSPNTNF